MWIKTQTNLVAILEVFTHLSYDAMEPTGKKKKKKEK